MKKRIFAVILSVCILLSCGLTAFAQDEESETPCLHENAQWELLTPATLITDSRYV